MTGPGQQEVACSEGVTAWRLLGTGASRPAARSVRIVTVAWAILLAVSVAVFIYLGIAMFMSERF
jgi:disulfide bond formation protein DsbB